MSLFNIKKLLIVLLCLVCIKNQSYGVAFKDVENNFWAHSQIDTVTNEKLMDGYDNNLFKPNEKITRADYAKMIVKTIKQQDYTIDKIYSFDDLDVHDSAWKYVQIAINLDIITPASENYFYPNDNVTRSDMITFLVNILKTEDITKSEALKALQNAYTDYDDIPDWFRLTAGKAEVLGVIPKEPPRENYLDYDKYITRAQMAVFLANLKFNIDKYTQEKIDAERSPKIGEGIIVENVYRDEDVVTIPEKTVLPIMVTGQIGSKESLPGDMFQAKFANNIVDYEHHILLSKDTILIGKILDTTKAKYLLKNGEIIFELSATNKNNHLTRILGVAQCEAKISESNKAAKITKTIIKGKQFTAKDGQILYIKLYKPMRVNIVTGEIFD